MRNLSDVKAIVKRAAEEAGFDLAGIAPAADAPELNTFPNGLPPAMPAK